MNAFTQMGMDTFNDGIASGMPPEAATNAAGDAMGAAATACRILHVLHDRARTSANSLFSEVRSDLETPRNGRIHSFIISLSLFVLHALAHGRRGSLLPAGAATLH